MPKPQGPSPVMPDLLDFEEPIAILLKEIEALLTLAVSDDRDREIARLESSTADKTRIQGFKARRAELNKSFTKAGWEFQD